MQLYGFVLGKNMELSLAEIFSYFRTRRIKFAIEDMGDDFVLLSSETAVDVKDFGGVIKIVKIVDKLGKIDLLDKTDPQKLFDLQGGVEVGEPPSTDKVDGLGVENPVSVNKVEFGVSLYGSTNIKLVEDVASKIKNQLREAGIKSNYMVSTERPFLTHVEVIKRGLQEIVLFLSETDYYVGKTIGVHIPFEFQKRDVGRPEQRAILSIPPRLCKIMINFLGLKGGLVLDPFCGIGTIIQEAALAGYRIKGMDIDRECVVAARKNLEWLEKEYKIRIPEIDRTVFKGDVKNLTSYFSKHSVDGIVAEPYLGPPVRGVPTPNFAKNIIQRIEPMYDAFFYQASIILKPGRRICIVTPKFRTGKYTVGMNLKFMLKKYGFKPVDPLPQEIAHQYPYTDAEERHKIIREINILEKTK